MFSDGQEQDFSVLLPHDVKHPICAPGYLKFTVPSGDMYGQLSLVVTLLENPAG